MSRRRTLSTPNNPVTIWNGVQYAASQKELEHLELEFGLDRQQLQPALVRVSNSGNNKTLSARNSGILQQRKLKERSKSVASLTSTGQSGSISTSCSSSSSGWILRYNELNSVTNFHPWSRHGEPPKFGQFDLVPWRRQKCSRDLAAIPTFGSECATIATNGIQPTLYNAKSLSKLEKLELRQNQRQLKRFNNSQKFLRRFVRVRLIFSVELRHKRMEVLRQAQLPQRVFEQKFSISEVENAKYERILLDANASVDDHLGYFSKRGGDMQLKQKLCNVQRQQLLENAVTDARNEVVTVADSVEKCVECDKIKLLTSLIETVAADKLRNARQKIDTKKSKTVPCDKCRDVAIKLGTATEYPPSLNVANKMHSHQMDRYDTMHSGSISSIERPNGGALALHYAAARGCLDCVQLLVEASADIWSTVTILKSKHIVQPDLSSDTSFSILPLPSPEIPYEN